MPADSSLHLKKLFATFLKIRPQLESFAHARTGSRATAEDLVQDTWARLETATLKAPIEHPGTFIGRITNHAIVDHARKERRRAGINAELSDLIWERRDDISPERIAIGRERLRAASRILDELPEKTRRIFLMNRIEGITHRRIAKQLGITDEAVYYHIRRALERLAELRDEFGG